MMDPDTASSQELRDFMRKNLNKYFSSKRKFCKWASLSQGSFSTWINNDEKVSPKIEDVVRSFIKNPPLEDRAIQHVIQPVTQAMPSPQQIERLKMVVFVDGDNCHMPILSLVDMPPPPDVLIWSFHHAKYAEYPDYVESIKSVSSPYFLQDIAVYGVKNAADMRMTIKMTQLDTTLPKTIPFLIISEDGVFSEVTACLRSTNGRSITWLRSRYIHIGLETRRMLDIQPPVTPFVEFLNRIKQKFKDGGHVDAVRKTIIKELGTSPFIGRIPVKWRITPDMILAELSLVVSIVSKYTSELEHDIIQIQDYLQTFQVREISLAKIGGHIKLSSDLPWIRLLERDDVQNRLGITLARVPPDEIVIKVHD
jgi:hypothetical protein